MEIVEFDSLDAMETQLQHNISLLQIFFFQKFMFTNNYFWNYVFLDLLSIEKATHQSLYQIDHCLLDLCSSLVLCCVFHHQNDVLDPEPITHCKDCERQFHSVCVQHMDTIWEMGYLCDACLKTRNQKRKENKYAAKSKCLSSFLFILLCIYYYLIRYKHQYIGCISLTDLLKIFLKYSACF